MFVILTYDIEAKRVKKVLKICRKYLDHIQLSVFEGMISDNKLAKLKIELKNAINVEKDSIKIYEIGNTKYCRKQSIGIINNNEDIIFKNRDE